MCVSEQLAPSTMGVCIGEGRCAVVLTFHFPICLPVCVSTCRCGRSASSKQLPYGSRSGFLKAFKRFGRWEYGVYQLKVHPVRNYVHDYSLLASTPVGLAPSTEYLEADDLEGKYSKLK